MRNRVEQNIKKLNYYADDIKCQLAIANALFKLDKNEAVLESIDIAHEYLDEAIHEIKSRRIKINNDLFYLLLTTPHAAHYAWFKTLKY